MDARAGLNDEAAFDRAWQDSGAMSLDQAVKYALEVAPPSCANAKPGRAPRAQRRSANGEYSAQSPRALNMHRHPATPNAVASGSPFADPRARAAATPQVTLLFTDIEGSTALWERDEARMSHALALHDALARSTVELHGGDVVKTTGDGFLAVFDDASAALLATLELQRALRDAVPSAGAPLRVRCGLHRGIVEHRDGDYFGSTVNRAARIMSAAHGGQILLSEAVADSVRDRLPALVSLRDLGRVRLRDLSTPECVYQAVHPQLRVDFPALRSLETTPNNLPLQSTRFIGRERELGDLKRLLATTRLLTLTGSGGCGKTRLGLQLAADSLESFPDGTWLVELAPLSDSGLVPRSVATVLGLEEQPGKAISATLIEHLKDKRVLMVIDNCEHLLDACAMLADLLVRRCPHLTILASSREGLGIAGEQTYRVPSLSLPDPKEIHTPVSVAPFEALQLFVDRCLSVRSDFRVTHENAATVVSICRRLDGIPLAIELAAARVRSLSVEEINQRLDHRFRLLTGGSRTALPRQQTLRSLIDWSYDLLLDPEKVLLQRLSVFAGGWTLEAAERICAGGQVEDGQVLDLLSSLVDKSLVAVEQGDGRVRYRLLETVRQYARERLLESESAEAIRERHRDYFLQLLEAADEKLLGAEQGAWLQRLEEEHDNLRLALEWSHGESHADEDLRLCRAMHRFWMTHGYIAEGRQWCARILAKPAPVPPTWAYAKCLNAAGSLAFHETDYPAARTLLERSLALSRALDDRKGVAHVLNNLGAVAIEQGDHSAARRLYEESLALLRELGDRPVAAGVLGNLAMVAHECDDLDSARALAEESLAMSRALGDRGRVADAMNTLANVACDQGDFVTASTLAQDSLAIGHELGDRDCIATSQRNLAMVAFLRGHLDEAQSLYRDALGIRVELGDRLGIARALEGGAAVAAARGDSLAAARTWGAAERVREEIGSPVAPNERMRNDRLVTAARTALGDERAFERAWKQGRKVPLNEAIELAMKAF
jgi:predicted ATPase/class 3 adenylate cyclase/Tfp pilus assembly protein PilF